MWGFTPFPMSYAIDPFSRVYAKPRQQQQRHWPAAGWEFEEQPGHHPMRGGCGDCDGCRTASMQAHGRNRGPNAGRPFRQQQRAPAPQRRVQQPHAFYPADALHHLAGWPPAAAQFYGAHPAAMRAYDDDGDEDVSESEEEEEEPQLQRPQQQAARCGAGCMPASASASAAARAELARQQQARQQQAHQQQARQQHRQQAAERSMADSVSSGKRSIPVQVVHGDDAARARDQQQQQQRSSSSPPAEQPGTPQPPASSSAKHGSQQAQQAQAAARRPPSRTSAAVTIQSVWRMWRLARQRSALRALAQTSAALAQTAAKFEAYREPLPGGGGFVISHKQYLELNELSMRVLLALDATICGVGELRAVRKRLSAKAVKLLDEIQAAFTRAARKQAASDSDSDEGGEAAGAGTLLKDLSDTSEAAPAAAATGGSDGVHVVLVYPGSCADAATQTE